MNTLVITLSVDTISLLKEGNASVQAGTVRACLEAVGIKKTVSVRAVADAIRNQSGTTVTQAVLCVALKGAKEGLTAVAIANRCADKLKEIAKDKVTSDADKAQTKADKEKVSALLVARKVNIDLGIDNTGLDKVLLSLMASYLSDEQKAITKAEDSLTKRVERFDTEVEVYNDISAETKKAK